MCTTNSLINILTLNNISFKRNLNLKNVTYSCTGSTANYYIQPTTINKLVLLVKELNKLKIDYLICGGTTNLLFLDFVNYDCIINTSLINDFSVKNNIATVSSGIELSKFVRLCLINGFVGFEGLEGIPGTIGGAVFQNAGAYGYHISDKIISVTCCDKKGNITIIDKNNCLFGKRFSLFQNEEYIILEVNFQLELGDINLAEKKIEAFHIARHSYQEWVYPNLGSVFVTNTNVYDSFSKKKITYKILLIIIKIITNNPVYKRWFRKSPSNKLKNILVSKLINSKIPKNVYSHKSINTFTNKGYKSIDILFYYSEMLHSLGEDARLENEIVLNPMNQVINEADYKEFKSIISLHKKIKDKIK
ncbi:TPA: FAD-binding protein [Escherichia coli]|uniref:FAD-binding protein n=1 Tax=Escherichia coli TaxID=562 RepID=UPI0018694682|nr:FAD-binding protein [Escherichia coli]HCJ9453888.1 FAD-binding protein [Escherichia coli]